MSPTSPTAATPSSPAAPATPGRPVWSFYGGLGILLGGALLLVATVVEAVFTGESTDPLMPLFTTLFFAAVILQCGAMLPFALGSTGANGVVGERMLGKWALLVFAAVYLCNQTVYYATAYGSVGTEGGVDLTGLVLGGALVQLVALVVASVAILRTGVARGAAKWAFPAVSAVAITAGLALNVVSSYEASVVALISSCVTQIIAGAVLVQHRQH